MGTRLTGTLSQESTDQGNTITCQNDSLCRRVGRGCCTLRRDAARGRQRPRRDPRLTQPGLLDGDSVLQASVASLRAETGIGGDPDAGLVTDGDATAQLTAEDVEELRRAFALRTLQGMVVSPLYVQVRRVVESHAAQTLLPLLFLQCRCSRGCWGHWE